MALTKHDVFVQYLQTGRKANRHLTRIYAPDVAGMAGEHAFAGLCQTSFRMRASIHEPHHAIGIYLWGTPGRRMAIAAWDDGGLCGAFGSLQEAKLLYSRPFKNDIEKIEEYAPAFVEAEHEDPVLPLISVMARLFRLPRYGKVSLTLSQLVFEKGFVSHGDVFSIISAGLRRPAKLVL